MRQFVAMLFAALACSSTAAAEPFSVVPTPNPSPERNLFRGVAGFSDTEVWAVGDHRVGSVDRHMIYHWNGAAWSPESAPFVNGNTHILFGATAAGADRVWAAGLYAEAGGLASAYILRRQGSGWDLEFTRPGWALFDIHAVAPDDVWAVGTTNDPRPTPALALHWTGSSWTRIDPPLVGDQDQHLEAIHASGPDNVWAVGYWRHTAGTRGAYVVRWDGSQWHHVPLPIHALTLLDVITFGPDDTWVTVDLGNVWHWDGSDWTEYPVQVGSFAGAASNDFYGFSSNQIHHWNGAAWTVVQILSDVTGPAFRNCAALLPDGSVWAAGLQLAENWDLRTLAIHKPGGTTSAVTPPAAWAGDLRILPMGSNPFRAGSRVALELSDPQHVTLSLFDASGRRLGTLHEGDLSAGRHEFTLDASALPAGLAFLRAAGRGGADMRKIVITR